MKPNPYPGKGGCQPLRCLQRALALAALALLCLLQANWPVLAAPAAAPGALVASDAAEFTEPTATLVDASPTTSQESLEARNRAELLAQFSRQRKISQRWGRFQEATGPPETLRIGFATDALAAHPNR